MRLYIAEKQTGADGERIGAVVRATAADISSSSMVNADSMELGQMEKDSTTATSSTSSDAKNAERYLWKKVDHSMLMVGWGEDQDNMGCHAVSEE